MLIASSDVHVYHFQKNKEQAKFARELYERIRRECKILRLYRHPWLFRLILTMDTVPELRIYRFWEEPIGPHPIAMFEVNLFTPAQFGAFIPWLVINRGPLSALVHPNTVDENGKPLDEERDHTQRATWLGEQVPLDLSLFKRSKEQKAAQ